MENLQLGLELMVIGMVSVFIILILIILLGKALVLLTNKIHEDKGEDPVPQVNDETRSVIEAAVKQLTGGKGRISGIVEL